MTNTDGILQPPDRLRALRRANEVRAVRATLRREIAEGRVAAWQVILDPPEAAASWAVAELIMTQRSWGHVKTARLLTRAGVNEARPIGKLTERQRELLASRLRPVNETDRVHVA